jgi:hypothetical protein
MLTQMDRGKFVSLRAVRERVEIRVVGKVMEIFAMGSDSTHLYVELEVEDCVDLDGPPKHVRVWVRDIVELSIHGR